MPANRKNVLIGKQNRLIATRLMQISLLVDDYVYQQKPMSQRSAAAYIREISAYKDKCYGDVRSLQVIEKLTRCMNGIILEQQDLNGPYVEDDRAVPLQEISKDNNDPMLSPVYSNPDEDLTQIPIEIHDKETDFNNNKDVIETREVTTERVSTSAIKEIEADLSKTVTCFNDEAQVTSTECPLNNQMEVIDLCDENIKDLISQSNEISHHEPDLHIQNAISNLSLRDIEVTFTPFSLGFSQSILDSYYPTYTCNTENSVQKDVALTHVTIARQEPVTEIVENNNIAKIVLPTNKRKVKVQTLTANRPIQNTQVMQSALKDTQTTIASEPKTKKRNVRKKRNTKLPSVETYISSAVKKKKKTVAKAKQKNVANETKPLNHEVANKTFINTTQAEKHSDHQYTKTQELLNTEETEEPLTSSTTQLDLKQITDEKYRRNDTLPIYNNVVVNDLSWVENIRFVREISSEEYESFTEDQVFWENYSLPSLWNEEDFNY